MFKGYFVKFFLLLPLEQGFLLIRDANFLVLER